MLFPAFSAIVLQMFFFPESALYQKRPAGRERSFYSFFLLFTVISALAILGTYLGPVQGRVRLVAAAVPQVFAVVGLLLLLVLHRVAGREAMSLVVLSWGKWREWPALCSGHLRVLRAASGAECPLWLGSGPSVEHSCTSKNQPRSVRDSDRGGIDPCDTDPGARHCFRRRVRLAGIFAKRAAEEGTGAWRSPGGLRW